MTFIGLGLPLHSLLHPFLSRFDIKKTFFEKTKERGSNNGKAFSWNFAIGNFPGNSLRSLLLGCETLLCVVESTLCITNIFFLYKRHVRHTLNLIKLYCSFPSLNYQFAGTDCAPGKWVSSFRLLYASAAVKTLNYKLKHYKRQGAITHLCIRFPHCVAF